MRATKSNAGRSRGSAAVELIILLPVILLIIFAMMYLGQLSLHKERMHFGGEYAMDAQGDQSEPGAVRGDVTGQFYPSAEGELTVTENLADPANIPETGEVREMFDEMCQIVYSTVATGQYVFSGGSLRFVVTTRTSETLSSDGQYVQDHHLLDDHIPELTTGQLQGWAERNRIEMQHTYRPDYIDAGRWPLEEVELSTEFQSAVRANKQREVTDPPGGSSHRIDTVTSDADMQSSGELPHYPEFSGDEPFWRPN